MPLQITITQDHVPEGQTPILFLETLAAEAIQFDHLTSGSIEPEDRAVAAQMRQAVA